MDNEKLEMLMELLVKKLDLLCDKIHHLSDAITNLVRVKDKHNNKG